jgi:type I site-specific restriction endonuclease
MPEQEYITAREVKQLLKLEQWHNEAPRDFRGRMAVNPERTLRKHNAEDVLAGVAFIEAHAPKGAEVRFPAKLVDELKQALPGMGAAGETVEHMATLLDAMQSSVSGDREIAPDGRASQAFYESHKYSERKRITSARIVAKHHRR